MKIVPAMLVTLIAATAIAGATAFGVSMEPRRSLMSPVDYGQEKEAIEARGREAHALCRGQGGQATDLCKAEAAADERVRKADLAAKYRGTTAAAAEASVARATARYQVARLKCAAERGMLKFSCLHSARGDKARAMADAKLASS